MGDRDSGDSLSDLITEAAFDTTKWVDVCDGMARLVGAYGATVYPSGPEMSAFGLPHSKSLDRAFDRYIKDGWFQRDFRFRSIETLIRQGHATDADCIDYDQIFRNEYYQELLRPEGLKWFAAIKIGSGENYWHVSVQRSSHADPFSEAELGLLLRYRAPLANAARIAREFGVIQVKTAASVLEQHGRAAFALAWDGRVAFASPRAMDLVGNVFQISGGHIRTQRLEERPALEHLVQSICHPNFYNASCRPIAIRRGENAMPLIAYGCTLPDLQRDIFKPAIALLIVSDPEKSATASTDLLSSCLKITKAEATLAAKLSEGLSLAEAASTLGITYQTARVHLRNIFEKTGTTRQGELIALIGKLNNQP